MPNADFPEPVKELIAELRRLPAIGPRSAERIAVHLLQNQSAEPLRLAAAIQASHESIVPCPSCGFFTAQNTCTFCDDPRRDKSFLCIVEQATDILPLERSGVFKGSYHCLGGKLSPLDHVSPDDLRIGPLLERIRVHGSEMELILALGADVEGEATSNYLADLMRGKVRKITRIAQGLPAGGGLEHAGELTLIRALQGRRDM